ncbi:MAG TPA: response regulator [Polyangiaceae bacterium]|nr:response regulator [Polyangiaceae bacterium]
MPEERSWRVLNVNDTESARYLVSRVLTSRGFEVTEARSGSEALELALKVQPDVIVLDIKLPDVSGYEVCRQLKNDPLTQSIAVIQTSATFVTSENKVLGLESGADAYLTQPFEPIELVAMVSALLRLKRFEAEARRRADELAEANRRKDEFLAMLAHELRNPLSTIVTGVKLLDEFNKESEQARNVCDAVQRQAKHLSRLIDDLLDVSRITQGKIELRREPIELGALVRAAVEQQRPKFEKRDYRVELSLPNQPVYVHADATRVEQILVNLLNNAERYGERRGVIQVSLGVSETKEPRALLSVKDDGVGIAPEHLSSLFELFYQVDRSLARSRSGLGIGLTMVKKLVELHGGQVQVRSDGLGHGSEFLVELPLSEPALAIEQPHAASTPEVGDAGNLRILLVDDNVDSCDMFRGALELAGHRVDCAYDGADGLRMALEKSYDTAVIDIGLPGLNGYEVAERLGHALGERRPFLVAMTGYGRQQDRKQSLEAGFDMHLVKPVAPNELERVLAQSRRSPRRAASAPQSDGADLA